MKIQVIFLWPFESGLVLMEEYPFIAASPDSSDDCTNYGSRMCGVKSLSSIKSDKSFQLNLVFLSVNT